MTVDFRRSPPALPPLSLLNSIVLAAESFRFLGSTISQNLKWETNINTIIKKAQQRMYFLHQLSIFIYLTLHTHTVKYLSLHFLDSPLLCTIVVLKFTAPVYRHYSLYILFRLLRPLHCLYCFGVLGRRSNQSII